MPSQRRPHRALRGGAAVQEWHEVLVLAAILGVGVLLVSTFALYSISDRQETGEHLCMQPLLCYFSTSDSRPVFWVLLSI